jgi:hypothetical protein
MMYILILLFKLSTASAFQSSEFWDQQNRLHLNFQCTNAEPFCFDLCQKNETCSFEEKVCVNCVGTSLLITSIFEQMGSLFQNTNEEISSYEFIDFIKQKKFVSFSSKSPFNQFESYDSPALKSRFQSLCGNQTDYPLVLFELNERSQTLKKIKFVICDDRVFRMTDSPDIIFNESTINAYQLLRQKPLPN